MEVAPFVGAPEDGDGAFGFDGCPLKTFGSTPIALTIHWLRASPSPAISKGPPRAFKNSKRPAAVQILKYCRSWIRAGRCEPFAAGQGSAGCVRSLSTAGREVPWSRFSQPNQLRVHLLIFAREPVFDLPASSAAVPLPWFGSKRLPSRVCPVSAGWRPLRATLRPGLRPFTTSSAPVAKCRGRDEACGGLRSRRRFKIRREAVSKPPLPGQSPLV